MQFKGRSSSKKQSKVSCCDSISNDKGVESCDHHARDTPVDAAEDVAFGLYRTGTEHLSTESVNRVKRYAASVQIAIAQINCKMQVDTGTSRSTVYMILNYQTIPLSLWEQSKFKQLFKGKDPCKGENYCTSES